MAISNFIYCPECADKFHSNDNKSCNNSEIEKSIDIIPSHKNSEKDNSHNLVQDMA